jgi:hypothetical protein
MIERFVDYTRFMYELATGNPFLVDIRLEESDCDEDDWNTAHLIE